ncbi:cilium assembly protein DZIP1 isoform X1 [Astyanax mexicanus]|uniref:cilium assembly protein DZIP1 isoform X1 n=1 Tax=Astyanax mexicanus TaxID=7994 RepID=UPI0020CB2C1B|nr:cilium assembly protein DZIP1 isoform X1 [Astyanax mexicanus]XP_049335527.1 cilium assembly protein DZIP1 isoform X1 [Astyanax mexicanus]
MPFYNNVYYPLPPDPQGAHSSAGIPSLLSSPQSIPSSGSQNRPTASAMSGVLSCGTANAPSAVVSSSAASSLPPPFKFRARRESVDWRRISALDVDQVASTLDFQTLQDHITAVTFCNIEGERCPRCQSPVDPALLKLFRLAQFTVEYLLHSQDCLTLSLQAAEERVQAEVQEREQLRAQLQKQTQDAKSLKEELKQRKKIITSQQSMITAGMANYHKCHHCEKAFMNASFLQSHMERRHPAEYDIKLLNDNQKKVQTMKLQEEVNRLHEQLTMARSQMEAQQKDHSAKQEKDLTQRHEEFMKQLEIWKEDERVRMNSKIDEVKQACQRDMDSLHQRNRNLEKEILKLQQSSRAQDTQSIQAQVNSVQNSESQPLQEVLQLQEKLHKQEMKWTTKMQKMKEEYEKSQLQALQANSSRSDREAEMQQQIQELKLMVQEQQRTSLSSSKQKRQTSSNPPIAVIQQEVIVPPAPEPKPKVVVSEQSSSVHKLDPIMELSEEDKDSSSISEHLPDTQSLQQKKEDLLRMPGLKRDMRVAVQQTLQDKLLSLGIHPGAGELSKTAYKSAITQLATERQQRQGKDPVYRKVQKEVMGNLEQKLKGKKTTPPPKPRQIVQAVKVVQSRPRSSSLPSTTTKAASGRPPGQQHTPQTAHRTGTLIKTSTPKLHQNRTPPFSSDEDSSEVEESEEESPQAQKVSHTRGPQVNSTTVKSLPRSSLKPVSSPQAPPARSAAQRSGVQQTPVVSVSRTEVSAVESESEWTEGSEMEEITLEQLQKSTDQNGNVQKIPHSSVKVLAKRVEQQLTERGLKKPAGGINTVPAKHTEALNTNNVVQKLKFTEINNDDDDDDWDISSLEDAPAAVKPSPAPVRKSTDKSMDSSTSVWDTSTGKGQKPGLKDAGTGSTLKSSIVTVSDWDDSDEF